MYLLSTIVKNTKMRAISLDTLRELNKDGFMLACCLCGGTPVQWHHNMIFGNRQSDEPFTILPLCRGCHEKADQRDVKDKFDWIMCNHATDEMLKPFSKVINWVERKRLLNIKFSVPKL